MTMHVFPITRHESFGQGLDNFTKFQRHISLSVDVPARGVRVSEDVATRVWAELLQAGRREQSEFRDLASHVVHRLSSVEVQVAELRSEVRSQVGELRSQLAEVRALLASRTKRSSQTSLRAILEQLPHPSVDTEPLTDEMLDLIFENRSSEE